MGGKKKETEKKTTRGGSEIGDKVKKGSLALVEIS